MLVDVLTFIMIAAVLGGRCSITKSRYHACAVCWFVKLMATAVLAAFVRALCR